ncbi:MAG: hypothetical protein GZ085_10610 [Sulfuriferula multivorans]|uniref:Uncharacterized protein n=1 Tax=Sulfuriferula multivorans TaxID=1559896 RepID=A0A7C9P8P3_9PROT|nr:hypothetical protein [Sulfuriferula multivorans]
MAPHDLRSVSKDDSAQTVADYLVSTMAANDTARARLLYWASLTYSISQPNSRRVRADCLKEHLKHWHNLSKSFLLPGTVSAPWAD